MKVLAPSFLLLALAACEGAPSTPAADSAKPTTPATTAKPAAPASATAKAETSAAAPAASASAAAGAGAEVDLSCAGANFAGVTLTAPSGAAAKVTPDSTLGAAHVTFAGEKFQVTVSPGKLLAADMKSGAKAGAESFKGKVSYPIDKADELEGVTEMKDLGGADVKSWLYGVAVTLGGKPFNCTSTTIANEAELAKVKAVCKSLAKK